MPPRGRSSSVRQVGEVQPVVQERRVGDFPGGTGGHQLLTGPRHAATPHARERGAGLTCFRTSRERSVMPPPRSQAPEEPA